MEAELILQHKFGQIFSCKGLITKNTDSLTCSCILQSVGTTGGFGMKQARHHRIIESQIHRMVLKGRDLKDHLLPNPLP